MSTSCPMSFSIQGCCKPPGLGHGLSGTVMAVLSSLAAACARCGMPGQAGLGTATCLAELSEERHPPGPSWQSGMGTSASFGLPAEGSASPRWEQAGGLVACGGRRAWGGGGTLWVALPERHWCAQFLLAPEGFRCCVGFWRSSSWNWCPGIPLPAAPSSQNTEDGGMGHPLKLTFPSLPRNPLHATTLGQPCPGIWVGRGSAGMEQGERRSPPSRAPHPRCQNPPLAAAVSGRSGQGKDAWNSCPGAERDRSKY